jgi:epoxyqueuosine reductase QueG
MLDYPPGDTQMAKRWASRESLRVALRPGPRLPQLIRKRLQQLAERIQQQLRLSRLRRQRAGTGKGYRRTGRLGWIGKNTLVLNRPAVISSL